MDISTTFQNENSNGQHTTISHQPSAISHQPSAISLVCRKRLRVFAPQMKSTSLHDTIAEPFCFFGRNRHLSLSDCASEKLLKALHVRLKMKAGGFVAYLALCISFCLYFQALRVESLNRL